MESQTLGSYQGIPCHHWDDELPLISAILRAARPHLIIEVGTMYGGFAAYLADVVVEWNGIVMTIDHVMYDGLEKVCAPRKNLFFVRGDVFNNFVMSLVVAELAAYDHVNATTMLYCDGGAKRQELFLLGHLASIVGVHDYATEVSPEDCETWRAQHNLVPVEEAKFAALQERLGGYFVSRFWARP